MRRLICVVNQGGSDKRILPILLKFCVGVVLINLTILVFGIHFSCNIKGIYSNDIVDECIQISC